MAKSKDAGFAVTGKLERHPLSAMFAQPSSNEELLALATDIEKNGQHQEIILFEGKVLDGWDRYTACMQKGITPKTKEYSGENPAAVAFGTNMIRRRLSSVQKAVYGAKYFLHAQAENKPVTQPEVSKIACVSLTTLNRVIQLLRSSDPIVKKTAEQVVANPELTTAALNAMLIDCGIVDPNTRRETNAANQSSALEKDLDARLAEGDDEGDYADEIDLGDDSLAGIIGSLEIDDDEDEAGDRPKSDGSNVIPLGTRGRVAHNKKAQETPASAASKAFKALTEPARVDFVKFAWAMLRPAIEKAVDQGRIDWPDCPFGGDVQADPSKAAFSDVATALTAAASDGQQAAGKGKKRKAA